MTDDVAEKRKDLMAEINEKAPEIADFLHQFKDAKEFNSRVVWIEIEGKVRLKWGKVV